MRTRCEFCRFEFDVGPERCPHCARPGLFPNVQLAEALVEKEELEKRYEQARLSAGKRGTIDKLDEFEQVVSQSRAVLARPLSELMRLASSDKQLYASFYQLVESEVKLPSGDKWDKIRRHADIELFPGFEKHIKFAALTIDRMGLRNYGECHLVLKDDMIAHRASVFIENSAIFIMRNIGRLFNLPRGYKTVWKDRGRLAVIKHHDKLEKSTKKDIFSGILLEQGRTSEDDVFIEVHIYGPFSIRSVESVTVTGMTKSQSDANKVLIEALEEDLQDYDVSMEVRV